MKRVCPHRRGVLVRERSVRVVWAAGSERLTHGLKAAGTHHTFTERDEHVKQKRQGAHPWRKRALVLSKHIIK